MKKKWIPVVAVIVFILICIACYEFTGMGTNPTERLDSVNDRMRPTTVSNLYYDVDTKIVYIMFHEQVGWAGYGYMSAYYAPNGLPYLYDPETNTLQEIISEQ